MSVDEFLKANAHPLKTEMLALRKIIMESAPSLTEQIKWNAPSFCHEGDDRITFNLSKPDTIMLIFHRGAKAKKIKLSSPLLSANGELLEWPAHDRAVLKVKSMTKVTALKSKLKTIVKDWIKVTSGYAA